MQATVSFFVYCVAARKWDELVKWR